MLNVNSQTPSSTGFWLPNTSSQTSAQLFRSKDFTRVPDQARRKGTQMLILGVYQQTACSDPSPLKLKGDKFHPHVQFLISFLDPHFLRITLSEEKRQTKPEKNQLQEKTTQRKKTFLKHQYGQRNKTQQPWRKSSMLSNAAFRDLTSFCVAW